MDELTVTVKTLLWGLGAIITIGGAGTVIWRCFNPYRKIKEDIQKAEVKLNKDYERLEQIDVSLKNQSETDKMVCRVLLNMLNHMITGNDISKLKDIQKELEGFIINKQ